MLRMQASSRRTRFLWRHQQQPHTCPPARRRKRLLMPVPAGAWPADAGRRPGARLINAPILSNRRRRLMLVRWYMPFRWHCGSTTACMFTLIYCSASAALTVPSALWAHCGVACRSMLSSAAASDHHMVVQGPPPIHMSS
jgi:hypothetical protein